MKYLVTLLILLFFIGCDIQSQSTTPTYLYFNGSKSIGITHYRVYGWQGNDSTQAIGSFSYEGDVTHLGNLVEHKYQVYPDGQYTYIKYGVISVRSDGVFSQMATTKAYLNELFLDPEPPSGLKIDK